MFHNDVNVNKKFQPSICCRSRETQLQKVKLLITFPPPPKKKTDRQTGIEIDIEKTWILWQGKNCPQFRLLLGNHLLVCSFIQ